MSGNTITEDMIKANAYDKVCPFYSSKRLINALEKNNVPYDYIEFPHSGHGLQNDNKLYIKYMEKINEYLEKYMGNKD